MSETRGKCARWVYLYSFAAVIGAIEMLFIGLCWWLLFRKDGIPSTMEEGYRLLSNQFRKFSYMELKKATKNFEEEMGSGASGVVFKDSRSNLFEEREDDTCITRFTSKEEVITLPNDPLVQALEKKIRTAAHLRRLFEWDPDIICADCLVPSKLLLLEFFQVLVREINLHTPICLFIATRRNGLYTDVKPENILLDGEFEPKISDFGLAKLSQRDSNNYEMSRIQGTKGYMAPEWALNLPVTAKVNVYSYGVVILELVKGIRLSQWVVEDGDEQETELTRFIKVVRGKMQGEEVAWVNDTVDTRLNGQFNLIQAEKMIEIGISCVDENRNKRPTMDSIVQALIECEDAFESNQMRTEVEELQARKQLLADTEAD
ncbi:putative S-locus lectin protein kinase family protein [Hibiscus syriacus]|uniref:S-locus lectin protein kinase family protein n=1 Tax=Hibiscus syriacus TaxID=106335 RepID=A0A6A2Y6E0_HIBSY|nr:putative S-locus lectin protein kinase family protein [Hibiscus syriacus]